MQIEKCFSRRNTSHILAILRLTVKTYSPQRTNYMDTQKVRHDKAIFIDVGLFCSVGSETIHFLINL